MDWDPIIGATIRDATDQVTGWILRTYGLATFSALMDDGTVRYYTRGSGRFAVDRPLRDGQR